MNCNTIARFGFHSQQAHKLRGFLVRPAVEKVIVSLEKGLRMVGRWPTHIYMIVRWVFFAFFGYILMEILAQHVEMS